VTRPGWGSSRAELRSTNIEESDLIDLIDLSDPSAEINEINQITQIMHPITQRDRTSRTRMPDPLEVVRTSAAHSPRTRVIRAGTRTPPPGRSR
jgi:hypothetical protein